jgi:hypothetical protein
MAVSVDAVNKILKFAAEDDTYTSFLQVKSVRFVAESGQAADDVIQLADPVTDAILWETWGVSATATEAQLIESKWRNGCYLKTMTSDNGTVYVTYE